MQHHHQNVIRHAHSNNASGSSHRPKASILFTTLLMRRQQFVDHWPEIWLAVCNFSRGSNSAATEIANALWQSPPVGNLLLAQASTAMSNLLEGYPEDTAGEPL